MKGLNCCVSTCENSRPSSTEVKFYRLPSGYQAKRRLLWLQAIQQANKSSKELDGNAHVCDEHFISRVASRDPNNPDFVPSVFTKRSPKRKTKTRYLSGKRRRSRKTSMTQDGNIKSPSKADSPVDDQSSVLMDTNTELPQDIETPSASPIPKDETEATTIEPQASTPNKTSPSVQVSSTPNKTSPSVQVSSTANKTSPSVQVSSTPNKTSPSVQVSSTPNKTSPSVQVSSTPNKTSPSVQVSSTPNKTSPSVQVSSTPNKTSPSVQVSSTPNKTSPSVQVSSTPNTTSPSVQVSPTPNKIPSSVQVSSTPNKIPSSVQVSSTPNKTSPSVHVSSTPNKTSPSEQASSTPNKIPSVQVSSTPNKTSPSVQVSSTPNKMSPSVQVSSTPNKMSPSVQVSSTPNTTSPSVQVSSTPNKTSPSVTVSACTLHLNKMKPTVLLKRIVVPESGYCHVLTNEDSTAESRLVRDEQLHEEQMRLVCVNCGMSFTNRDTLARHRCAKNDEPSFACNMCDRSFASSKSLKRHKLLHVRDARKCGKCGVLFCRRHNHVMSHPIAKAEPQTEEESSENEESNGGCQAKPKTRNLMPEKSNLMPEESNLMSEESNLMPEESNLMSEESNVMPEESNLMSEESNVMPEERNVMLEESNVMSEESNVMSEESNVMSEESNVMPEESNVMSEERNVMLEESNLLPEESDSPGESNFLPNYSVLLMFEQSQTHDVDGNAQNAMILTPLLTTTVPSPAIPTPTPETQDVPHPVSHCEIKPKFLKARLKKPFPMPHPPVNKPLVKKNNFYVPPPAPCPAAFLNHPERSTSLKIFSPQYLTSAFLKVKRNYDYIVSDPVTVKAAAVKEEPHKLPLFTPRNPKPFKKERIAYDIEIEI